LKPVDFRALADRPEGQELTRKHYLIVSIEQIIKAAERFRWSLCMNDGFVYIYNGAYWKQLSRMELQNFLGECAEKLGVDKFDARHFKFREELTKQFLSSAFMAKPPRSESSVAINLRNGTFVFTASRQELRQFDRKDFMTYQLPFEYEEYADAPLFHKYLDRVLPGKVEQGILAEYIGYIFIKSSVMKLEKALVLYGNGANGKSVFFEIVNALLGPENVSSYGLENLTNVNGYYRAMISNKLVNYASEISPRMDSTIFKQLVSGEPVEARLPHHPPLLIKDYAKLIFNTNSLPKDVEQNIAFFRRFIIVEFDVTIPEEERDPELSKKIIERELPGVFNWALDGLRRLLNNGGFSYSQRVAEAINKYRVQSDSVQQFLEESNYTPGQSKEQFLQMLYNDYREFCENSGNKPCSKNRFADRLRGAGYDLQRKAKGMVVFVNKTV
jgi:putative DNA primase/helicase